MINSLHIENFKSIRDMDLKLGTINCFIGANGAGKTNILEAIGVVSAAVFGVVDDEALLRRGIRPGVPRLYKTSNKKYKMSPHIAFTVGNQHCKYRVSLLNPLDKPKPKWNFKTESLESDDLEETYTRGVKTNPNSEIGGLPLVLSRLQPDSSTAVFLSDLREYALYNPNTPVLRGIVPDSQPRQPVGLAGGGLADGLQQLLSLYEGNDNIEEAIDDVESLFPWVSEMSTSTQISQILSSSLPRNKRTIIFEDRFMKQKYNKLTAVDASEGILYAIFLLVLCHSPHAPNIFAIDNIDQALNPRLLKHMIQLLQKWLILDNSNRQLFCTVHNPVVLDNLNITDNDVKLFVVDRDSNGITVASPINITEELISKSKELHITLSQLWTEGFLGGEEELSTQKKISVGVSNATRQ